MSEKKSKFSFLNDAHRARASEPNEETTVDEMEPPAEVTPPSPALPESVPAETAPRRKPKPREQTPETPRRVGRPTGKRSDGEHVQVTAYIRKDTHLKVKTSLLQEQRGRDFSELVEELLAKWLRSRT